MLGITRSTGGNDNSLGVIEIAFSIMSLIEWRGVVVPQSKVEGQLGRGFVVVLNESAISVLAVAEVGDCRNDR